MTTVFFLGPPCAGKTSIARVCTKKMGAVGNSLMVSTGDIVRHLAETDIETREALARGEMAPEERMNDYILQYLLADIESFDVRWVDGYPRYADQLFDVLAFIPGRHLFIHVETPEDTRILRSRVRGREDDNYETWIKRQDEFDRRTLPMLEWLERRGLVAPVLNLKGDAIDRAAKIVLNHVNVERGLPGGFDFLFHGLSRVKP